MLTDEVFDQLLPVGAVHKPVMPFNVADFLLTVLRAMLFIYLFQMYLQLLLLLHRRRLLLQIQEYRCHFLHRHHLGVLADKGGLP